MRQSNISNPLTTVFLYILFGALLISFFIGMFPFIIILIIIAACGIGFSFLYQYIRSKINNPENPHSKYDEHGSRKIKASVIEMKDLGNKENRESQEETKK